MTDDAPGPVEHHPRALSRERRSPTADAFDPAVLKAEWTLPAATPLPALLAELRERVGDDAAFERLMRHGGIHLDRRRLSDFAEPPATLPAGTAVIAYWFTREPEPLVLPDELVLLDEGGLVAVSKPPWWTTQGTRASRFASLERALRERLACPALTPIHRLDRETTGVLLFARDSRAASEAGKQFIARSIRKEYLCVTPDLPGGPSAWEVKGRMARIEHPSHSLFALDPGVSGQGDAGGPGVWSATRFEIAWRDGARGLAVVRAQPLTGRTHQLRVHLAASDRPIIGDSLYGEGHVPDAPFVTERMLLHARALTLRAGGVERTIEAPVPGDFPPPPSDAVAVPSAAALPA